MAAFALVFRRDRQPVTEAELCPMLAALKHRGPDGSSSQVSPCLALGSLSFRTTPEASGAQQPLSDPTGLSLVFDGRLDERMQLGIELRLAPEQIRRLSDAELVLAAYQRWGKDSFPRLLGPFALAIHNRRKHSVVCARDPLGSRTLFIFQTSQWLILGSEEAALLAHPALPGELDEARIAEYFSLRMQRRDRTFFAAIRELPAAHCLEVGATSETLRPFWHPTPRPRIRYHREAEYGEHFAEILSRSVASRLRSATPPALLLSGGLDSSSLAALATLPSHLPPTVSPLTTLSWIFDELPDCDERPYLHAMDQSFNTRPIHLTADGAWPLRDRSTLGLNPNTPEDNPYRQLKSLAYEAAARGGHRVLLDGVFGDQLYSGAGRWLLDLCLEGRWLTAGRELFAELRRGPRRALLRAGLGTALAQFNLRRPPPWLTADAASRMQATSQALPCRRPEQDYALLGPRTARSATVEIFHAQRHGIDLRHPYRDLRLVEFMLAVPAHQLYRHGRFKHILRQGLSDLLPATIRERVEPSNLTPLFRRGILDREFPFVRSLLLDKDTRWQQYVHKKYIHSMLENPAQLGIHAVLLWQCISFEAWIKRHCR